jgi:hypothetical protein
MRCGYIEKGTIMPNADSIFRNVDYKIVRVRFYTSGTENMQIYQGQSDRLKGPEGGSYNFAWKARDETITDDEMQEYGDEAMYGEEFSFGTPRGQIP